jgi:glucosylceramidase
VVVLGVYLAASTRPCLQGAVGSDGGIAAGAAPAEGVQVWLSDGDLGLHEAGVGHTLILQTALRRRYLSAQNGGGGAITADRERVLAWEIFTLVDLNGGDVESGDLVYVRCHDGSWLSAANAGGSGVSARAARPRSWETFVVQRVAGSGPIRSGDEIALRTRDGVHYLSAIDGGGAGVVASAPALRGWEAFVATLGPAQTRWMDRQANLAFSRGAPAGAIVVDDAIVGQTVVGFGSSFSQSAAWLLEDQLDPGPRAAAMAAMFDAERGIGLGAMRLPMGATDMMSDPTLVYTYDDVPPGQDDMALSRFSLARDEAYVIPLVKEALALAPGLFIVASPWSPPAWMKSTGTLTGGTLRDDDRVRAAYAHYFVRFLQGYAAAGVAIRAVTPQNEPLYQPAGYPSCGSDPASEARLVGGFLGPALAKAAPGTSILAYDHNWDDTAYPLRVLGDAAAEPYVAGAAFHCYGGTPDAQARIHAAYPSKDVWVTECSDGDWETDPFRSKMWLLVESMRHWARGVILWNLAMTIPGGPSLPDGCKTCRGVVAVDPATGSWLPTVQFHALGHFSRFVRPGAVRIASDGGPGGLGHVAFRNADGTHVLVVSNQGKAGAAFSVVMGGKSFSYQLAGGGAVTLRW